MHKFSLVSKGLGGNTSLWYLSNLPMLWTKSPISALSWRVICSQRGGRSVIVRLCEVVFEDFLGRDGEF
jgi:hypothetical protein